MPVLWVRALRFDALAQEHITCLGGGSQATKQHVVPPFGDVSGAELRACLVAITPVCLLLSYIVSLHR